MNLKEFVRKNNVERSKCPIDKDLLTNAEKEIGVSFGKELADYLCEYGYLAYGAVELYGINAIQGMKSDMITQTLYLHKYFPATLNYIALENQGEGDYFLVDSSDKVVEFDSSLKEIIFTKHTLSEYIISRFS